MLEPQFEPAQLAAASNSAHPSVVNIVGPLAHSGNVTRQAGAAWPLDCVWPGESVKIVASVPERATTVAAAVGRP